ncbi:hypothetical protein GBF38_006661 [Nibea albiflora]|uniref:Uncharacterized protein n=1 Tax=Nibea albiflora TaxID=240163 RepID=A0ACB7EGX8_NIBAL|nr:hypothetical protein GBF38_006661 [Nibea albiflora]
MKTLVTLLLLTVICFQCYKCAAPVALQESIQLCCINTTRIPIPKGKVQHVAPQNSACEVKAIIVTTVCNKKICIDADWQWSKNLLAEFERSWSVSDGGNMKTLVTLLLLTVICFQCYKCAAPVALQESIQLCCINTTRIPIPKGKVQHVAPPNSACEVKAIIVTTVCNKKICIDADWQWSKNLLAEFESHQPGVIQPASGPPMIYVFVDCYISREVEALSFYGVHSLYCQRSASSVSVLFTLFSSAIMSIEAAESGYIAWLRFWHDTGSAPPQQSLKTSSSTNTNTPLVL